MSCGCKHCQEQERKEKQVSANTSKPSQAKQESHQEPDMCAAGNFAMQKTLNGSIRAGVTIVAPGEEPEAPLPESSAAIRAEVGDAGATTPADGGSSRPYTGPLDAGPAPDGGVQPTDGGTKDGGKKPPDAKTPCALSISGPDTVDHYCAAYVPSDAASCGTFPAKSITLTAAGGASGATLTWSVTAGTTKASIDGAKTGASVKVKGDAASGKTKGDVTVQVTDGKCTATKTLTVLEPTTISDSQTPTTSASLVQIVVIYTVKDQYGQAMGDGICVDETITVCHNSLRGASFSFGDAPTTAGQVQDTLSADFSPGTVPNSLCVKLNQTITAGGCGPLLRNTITMQKSGIVLTHGSSCAAGDPCP